MEIENLRNAIGEACLLAYDKVASLFRRSQDSIEREADEWLEALTPKGEK